MVFGGVGREQLQLNEETLWSGGPYQPINPDALPHLAEVRQLIFAGRYAEAEALANRLSRWRGRTSRCPTSRPEISWLDFAHEACRGSYRR